MPKAGQIGLGIDRRRAVVDLHEDLAGLVDRVDVREAGAILVLDRRTALGGAVRRAEPETAVGHAGWPASCVWALASITRLGLNPTPVIACAAGAAPVDLRKLPGLTFTPLSASENTRAAALLPVLVKFSVKPSAFIETHDALLLHGQAVVERVDRGVGQLAALRVARARVVDRSSWRAPTGRRRSP